MIEMQTKYQVPFDTQANVTIRLISNSFTISINPLRHWGAGRSEAVTDNSSLQTYLQKHSVSPEGLSDVDDGDMSYISAGVPSSACQTSQFPFPDGFWWPVLLR